MSRSELGWIPFVLAHYMIALGKNSLGVAVQSVMTLRSKKKAPRNMRQVRDPPYPLVQAQSKLKLTRRGGETWA